MLKLVAVALLALLGLAALAAVWAWSNRYDLFERQAITYLGSLGIDADLDIRSASGQAADIRNIRLSHDGEPFLTLDRLQAAYQWRDLLNGQVERLDFAGLNASITIDESGAIVDGWMPPSTGTASAFPVRGIGVEDARLELRTPFGNATIAGQAEATARDRFRIDGEIEGAELKRNGTTLSASGPVVLERDGGPYRLESPRMSVSLDHPSGALEDATLSFDGTLRGDALVVQGSASLDGGSFSTQAGVGGRIQRLDVTGRWADRQATADLDVKLEAVGLRDADRRQELSRTLSLASALSDVPVAQNFAPSLVPVLEGLLERSDIEALLRLGASGTHRELALRGPMAVRSETSAMALDPLPEAPLYRYDSGAGHYDIAAVLRLNHPLPLRLDPLRLQVRSGDGLRVDGIGTAEGRIVTEQNWQARTSDGRPARLGPLSVGFEYTAPEGAPSQLTLRGAADYNGDIPGGYVQALQAGGTLRAEIGTGENRRDGAPSGDGTVLVGFNPDRALRMGRLETPSEWTVEDFEGRLQPGTPIYSRSANAPARVRTGIVDASLRATRPESDGADAAALDLQFARADLDGSVGKQLQDWSVAFRNLALQSKTFPVEGTDLVLPEGTLDVALSTDARTRFSLTAPDSTLKTLGYAVRGMALSAQGTAERYTMDYEGGRVRLIPQSEDAVPLPVLPASGTLLFQDGAFSGRATTLLPRTPDNPIELDYVFRDGRGEADVLIEDLRFRPRGLQPQDLAPALRGKIAEVDGAVDARLHVLFGGDAPLSGTGVVSIKDMALGTAPGPVTGLSGEVELVSLFPVVTAPEQRLSVATFNPGFPLENGSLTYALVADGVDISRAVFPLGGGEVSFDPFQWTYGAVENRVTLRVSGVEVGEFLNETSDGRLSVTGKLEGSIPVVVRGIDVLVENGRLEVAQGGLIQYKAEDMAERIPNEYAGQAIQALENFAYDSLFLELNGPLDGEVKLGVAFTGSNPDVLYNVPFAFDVTVEGELFNIARSLNPNGLQDRVLSSIQPAIAAE
ncbi:MAG: YdbH domain-containing protein [Pseudomonadota bacterium]